MGTVITQIPWSYGEEGPPEYFTAILLCTSLIIFRVYSAAWMRWQMKKKKKLFRLNCPSGKPTSVSIIGCFNCACLFIYAPNNE